MAQYQELLTWQRLYDWAEGKAPGTILGYSCTNAKDPIGNYLQEYTGIQWSVGPSIRPAAGTPQDRLEKPQWIKVVIEKMDAATSQKSGPIIRELFLKILEDVKDIVEPYIPTLAEEALILSLLTHGTCQKIIEEYTCGNFGDVTYSLLNGAAQKADAQARKIRNLLEKKEETK